MERYGARRCLATTINLLINSKYVFAVSSQTRQSTSKPTKNRLQKVLRNVFPSFYADNLKQLGDVEKAVPHEETEIASNLCEQRELCVADEFRCHLHTLGFLGFGRWEEHFHQNLDISPEVENHLPGIFTWIHPPLGRPMKVIFLSAIVNGHVQGKNIQLGHRQGWAERRVKHLVFTNYEVRNKTNWFLVWHLISE